MKVIEGIHRINDLKENAYLLTNGELILIDSGRPGSAQKILKYMRSIGLEPSDLSKIILTHHHIDHMGGVPELKEKTNAKVVLHEKEAKILSGELKTPGRGIMSIFSKFLQYFYQSVPIEPDLIVKEGDEISGLEVVNTPGHTPGSISLYDKQKEIMFVGDAIVFSNGNIRKPTKRSCWDFKQAGRSIKKLTKFDFEIMLSGHGKPLEKNATEKIKKFCQKDNPD